jgi:hypothetical protein
MPSGESLSPALVEALADVERAVGACEPERLPALMSHLAALQSLAAARLLTSSASNGHDAPTTATTEASDWCTVAEAARCWRKSDCWVYRRIRRGEVPGAQKIGGTWRIPASVVRPTH